MRGETRTAPKGRPVASPAVEADLSGSRARRGHDLVRATLAAGHGRGVPHRTGMATVVRRGRSVTRGC